MKYLFIYLFIYLFVGCNKSKPDRNVTAVKFNKVQTLNNKKSIDSIQEESQQPIDTLSINQCLFNNESFNILYKELRVKEKDSIVFLEWTCGSPFDWASDSLNGYEHYNYYSCYTKNKLRYITNKHDAILFSGKFEGGNELRVKNRDIELSSTTTLNDFKIFFPNSYKHYIKTKNKFPQDYKNSDYIYVAFEIEHPYDHWIFYFDRKGYLVQFELYWWLC